MANFPKNRESCSFCDECIEGSSATVTTNPPLTPVIAELMKASAAHLIRRFYNHTLTSITHSECRFIAVFHAPLTMKFSFYGGFIMLDIFGYLVEGVPG
jgi:hypothetical protein